MKSKKIAAAGLGLGLLAGGGAGLVLTLPGGAGAATSTAVVSQADDTTPPAPNADGTDARPEPGARMKEQLDTLVTDGTITQEQADAIVAAFEANRPDRTADGAPGPMGDRGPRGPHGPMAGNLDIVTGVLGLTAEELRTELQDGKTLAEIATANGVDPQDVIDALVADATLRITDMVTNGRPERPVPTTDAGS